MTKARDHLPNAKLIDWVIADLKDNSSDWYAAWDAKWAAAWDAARRKAVLALDAARDAARDEAWDEAWPAARDAEWDAAGDAAWNAITALVAFDDCIKYLDMTPDELQVWGELSSDPSCLLLIPMSNRLRSLTTEQRLTLIKPYVTI